MCRGADIPDHLARRLGRALRMTMTNPDRSDRKWRVVDMRLATTATGRRLAPCRRPRFAIVGMWAPMGIGLGVFLMAVGASLVLEDVRIAGGLNLSAVGWVLMAMGLTGLIVSFYLWNRRRGRPAAVVRPSAIVDLADSDETTVALPLAVAWLTATATAPVVPSSLSQRDS